MAGDERVCLEYAVNVGSGVRKATMKVEMPSRPKWIVMGSSEKGTSTVLWRRSGLKSYREAYRGERPEPGDKVGAVLDGEFKREVEWKAQSGGDDGVSHGA